MELAPKSVNGIFSLDTPENSRTMAQMVHFFKTSIRILNSPILNSEFRISKKKVVYGNLVFGDATSGSVHGVGQGIQNWNNSNNSIV